MSVFGTYASYYDLLYKDKDYAGETRYVNTLIQQFAPDASSLLDIGCGTGRHAEVFSQMGFKVVGLDRSEDMISRAKRRGLDINFHHSDLCDIQLDNKFDVVTALFHVISYLTSDDALRSAFQTVKECLKPDGLFVFDCWHGPAVLHQLPEVRIKRLEEGTTRMIRVAEPSMVLEENRVDVNFQIFIKENGVWDEFSETHSMRYLFQSEIEELLSDSGLQLLHTEQWLTANNPGKDTWSVVYVARTR